MLIAAYIIMIIMMLVFTVSGVLGIIREVRGIKANNEILKLIKSEDTDVKLTFTDVGHLKK